MPKSTERTALYRLFGDDDQLLYVGISSNPKRRWRDHANQKHWWPEVAEKTIEWFESRALAEEAERTEVGERRPRYNRNHNGERRWELQNEDIRRQRPKRTPSPWTPRRDFIDWTS
ncbi:GIY-YIG nuclease family protein [Streptomyces sp. NPDC006207]